MRRLLLTSVLVVGVLSGLVQGGTLATFTDLASSTGNQFASGTVDIAQSPASALLEVSNMVPGDTLTASLTVTNSGSLAQRYAVTASATNLDGKGLKDQLVVTIKTVDVTTPGTPCNDLDGTTLYTGDLDGASGALIGSIATGHQYGDRYLSGSTQSVDSDGSFPSNEDPSVAPTNEVLCFRANLPSSTGTGFQGASTTATLTFTAEQVANNP